jgi:hypothetical protein
MSPTPGRVLSQVVSEHGAKTSRRVTLVDCGHLHRRTSRYYLPVRAVFNLTLENLFELLMKLNLAIREKSDKTPVVIDTVRNICTDYKMDAPHPKAATGAGQLVCLEGRTGLYARTVLELSQGSMCRRASSRLRHPGVWSIVRNRLIHGRVAKGGCVEA